MSEAGQRRPMRGIAVMNAEYAKGNWRLQSRTGDGREWTAQTQENVRLYTTLRAALREHPYLADTDYKSIVRLAPSGRTLRVVRVTSTVLALATIPGDADVRTLNWNLFRTNVATLRNLANPSGGVTRPLRESIEAGKVSFRPSRGMDEPEGWNRIANLDEFSQPALAKLTESWDVRIRPMEFIEAGMEATQEVSRVPAVLKLHAFTEPDWDTQKELVEGLPDILNQNDDPELIPWLIYNVIRPGLRRKALRGRSGLGSEEPVETGEYIRARLSEINSPVLRQRIAQALDPSPRLRLISRELQ